LLAKAHGALPGASDPLVCDHTIDDERCETLPLAYGSRQGSSKAKQIRLQRWQIMLTNAAFPMSSCRPAQELGTCI
jgi:hypothetical protein